MPPNTSQTPDFIDPNAPSAEEIKRLHPMVVLRPGERVIAEIKRHPIGIFMTYLGGVLSIVLIMSVAVMAPTLFGDVTGSDTDMNLTTAALVLGVILSVGISAIMFVATTVYWQNRWIVTDDSITQITQHSLLGRRVSQLSLESLEDITVEQHGLLQTMFNFGTLHAETAGEKSKFVFNYCPQPNKRARQILEAHEYFLHQTKHQPQPVSPAQPTDGEDVIQAPAAQNHQATYPQQYAQQPQPQAYSSPQYGAVQQPQQYVQPGQPMQYTQVPQAPVAQDDATGVYTMPPRQQYQQPQQYAAPQPQYQPPHFPQDNQQPR